MRVYISLILVGLSFSGCSTDMLESLTFSKEPVRKQWMGCIELEKYMRRDWLFGINNGDKTAKILERYLIMCLDNVQEVKDAEK